MINCNLNDKCISLTLEKVPKNEKDAEPKVSKQQNYLNKFCETAKQNHLL